MPDPTIALLVPAYNAAEFLPRLLSSAAQQNRPFDSIWIYNDCSTDDTVAVAKAFGANVLSGEVNKGCSAGKNALAQHVNADYLHFHDADDDLLPHFTERAHHWIANDPKDVVLFAYEYRDFDTDELISIRVFDPEDVAADARSFAIREQINPFCGLYKRTSYLAAGGYDEDPEVLYNEDVAFHIRLAFADLSFAADETVSVINFRRGGSMSGANQLKCHLAHFAVMKKLLKVPGTSQYATEIAANLWKVSGLLAANSDWRNADLAADMAKKIAPISPTAGSAWFRAVSQCSPSLALRAREVAVRLFKPSLRT